MFILPFLLLILSVFLLLWGADIFFTIKSIENKGLYLEVNPVVRFLFGIRKTFFWIFKSLELFAFFVLIYFISFRNATEAVTVLLIVTLLYSIIVAQGMNVYLKSVRNTMPVMLVFFLLCVATIGFIWLNYTNFLSSIYVSDALSKCGSDYAQLYWQCTGKQIPANFSKTITDFGLNLTIMR